MNRAILWGLVLVLLGVAPGCGGEDEGGGKGGTGGAGTGGTGGGKGGTGGAGDGGTGGIAAAADGGGDAGAGVTVGAVSWTSAIGHVGIYKVNAAANTCTRIALSMAGGAAPPPTLTLPEGWRISGWVNASLIIINDATDCMRVFDNAKGTAASATAVSGTIKWDPVRGDVPNELDVNVTLNFDKGAAPWAPAVDKIEGTKVPVVNCGVIGGAC